MTDHDILRVRSPRAVPETVARLEQLLGERGLKLFAIVDHSGEAERAGLSMRPTKLLIFGNPKSGTPVMVAAPSAAIDLPMKALVAEDPDGSVWISWNAPDYLRDRHRIPEELMPNLAAINGLLRKAVE